MPKKKIFSATNVFEILKKKRKLGEEVPGRVTILNLTSNPKYARILKDTCIQIDDHIKKTKEEAAQKALDEMSKKYGDFLDNTLAAFKQDRTATRKYNFKHLNKKRIKDESGKWIRPSAEKQATAHGKTDHGE